MNVYDNLSGCLSSYEMQTDQILLLYNVDPINVMRGKWLKMPKKGKMTNFHHSSVMMFVIVL